MFAQRCFLEGGGPDLEARAWPLAGRKNLRDVGNNLGRRSRSCIGIKSLVDLTLAWKPAATRSDMLQRFCLCL